ncbi:Sodium/hydrogen exchanger 7 (Na(+)/H(+) exchanger 7) (NHE-7) (Protein SALT OVERLY SENSITIVE 1) [Durusdinium trenchii]|uniref:Sodium/hydrogen exchanger 7 (Na(+)/H(+) exchanger 7) (NHE-7) (Protein SALT OVERLY SENSITIVE 1) n=1 Tax=Durusdinium trenchii TaxID=1381693 RepID=A0ABP0JPY2_9DINO
MLSGMTITHITSRCPRLGIIPYTVALLIVGYCIGFLDIETGGGLGTLSQSISLWIAMDPHLLLFAFLPVLLFGDAMSIVWHDFQRTAAQCVLLAGPGVLIGTALMYLVAKYIFPFGWSDFECAAFGSVLAATDPVAVVGLLKEMGASRVLTMQIAGESLLNDGVAIVVWLVFFNFMKGGEAGAEILWSFLRLAAGGCAFGVVCGLVGSRWISLASDRLVHTDSLVQVTLTITVAYVSFFVGENELKVSGVLATIFTALMVSRICKPLLCDKDGLQAIWHTLEFFGNTILFVLCGVFAYTACKKVEWADFAWLGLLDILGNLARGLMIAMLAPLVNLVGGSDVTRTTWRECVVMTWGGLRGAVGLALVLSMRDLLIQQGKEYTANLMVFFISGFATLTLLINATTCSLLLKYLGLTKMAASKKAFSDSLATDERFKAVHQHLGIPVMQQSSILKSIKSSRHHILRRELDMLLEHLEEELGDPSQD